jgi:hypothetical protein
MWDAHGMVQSMPHFAAKRAIRVEVHNSRIAVTVSHVKIAGQRHSNLHPRHTRCDVSSLISRRRAGAIAEGGRGGGPE